MTKIHALWCHPRSVSTAFERLMRARGDLQVLHEPFMYFHYLEGGGRVFPGFDPAPDHPVSYAGIREMIRAQAKAGPVFFKDMAYYISAQLPADPVFAGQMTHAFLVRDPVAAAASYACRDPDFSQYELGHAAQADLYDALVGLGQDPLVLTADQLRADPETTLRRYWDHIGLPFAPHAFHWDAAVPKGWEAVQSWHQDVLRSGGIRQAAPAAPIRLDPPHDGYATYHAPFYAKLKRIAEAQAHQK